MEPTTPQPTATPVPPQPRRISGDTLIALGAVLISLFAVGLTYWQGSVAQQTDDRAAGRIPARVEVLDVTPKADELPAHTLDTFHPSLSFKTTLFRKVDELLNANPRILFKNTGDEPVEAVRVETRFVLGMIDLIDAPRDMQLMQAPFVLHQAEREDYPLSRKLQPGETALVPVARGLLGQMVQAQDPAKEDRKHMVKFGIRCFGRIVGGSSFDAPERHQELFMTFMWLPNGFPEEKCKKLIETMQPAVEVVARNARPS